MRSTDADQFTHAGLRKPPRNKGKIAPREPVCPKCGKVRLKSAFQAGRGLCRYCRQVATIHNRAAGTPGRKPRAPGPTYQEFLRAKVVACEQDGMTEEEIAPLILYWRLEWQDTHGTHVGLPARRKEDACSDSCSD